MKQTTKSAIAQLLASAGAVLSAFAAEFGAAAPASAEAAAAPAPEPEKPKRTRQAKTEAPPAPEPEKQEATEEEPAPDTEGKTYEDMKAIIQPFVEAGRGAEVKKIIAKYGESLKTMDPKHYAAFEKDIATLEY